MKLKFFGCSFTEGGGLDNIDYYNFLNENKLEYLPDKFETTYQWQHRDTIVDKLEQYKVENRFSTILEKKLNNARIINLAVSQASNDYIFDKLYDVIDKNSNEIYIVFLTMITRRYWYYDLNGKKYNLNRTEFDASPFNNEEELLPLNEHYKKYLEIIFKQEDEMQRVFKQIKLLDIFAKSKNSKIIWSSWEMGDEMELDVVEKYAENVLKFEGKTLKQFCIKHKLQIHDDTNELVQDNHISLKGNEIIAEKIYEHLQKSNII